MSVWTSPTAQESWLQATWQHQTLRLVGHLCATPILVLDISGVAELQSEYADIKECSPLQSSEGQHQESAYAG